MLVVSETPPPALARARVQHRLAGMPEGRVAEVVAEPDRLGEVLVQAERARHAARDAAGLERVRKPGAVVVALRRDEDLGLVLQAPERLRVHDPVAVALERRRVVRVGLLLLPHGGVRASRERGQRLVLEPLHPLPEGGSGELGHAPVDCVSSLGERLEGRRARVQLVEAGTHARIPSSTPYRRARTPRRPGASAQSRWATPPARRRIRGSARASRLAPTDWRFSTRGTATSWVGRAVRLPWAWASPPSPMQPDSASAARTPTAARAAANHGHWFGSSESFVIATKHCSSSPWFSRSGPFPRLVAQSSGRF